ncbi:interleukin-15 isoform 2-T3 [Discoglossus pictus]
MWSNCACFLLHYTRVSSPEVSSFRCMPISEGSKWQNMLRDLSKIDDTGISRTTLYTPSGYIGNCVEYALYCYLLEIKVIEEEVKLLELQMSDYVEELVTNLWMNSNLTFGMEKQEWSKCRRCELSNERNHTEFLKGFKTLLHYLNSREKD